MSSHPKTLKKCNPNRHGWVTLLEYSDTEFYVVGPEEDEEASFDNREEAERYYESRRYTLGKTPNWDAQAEYDEQWGEPLPVWPSPGEY
jgi:hypothetical protein